MSRIKNFAHGKINQHLEHRRFIKSFSQEGEDMLLRKALGNKKRGFYVDVGAFHPSRYSNTKHFYQKGWRGMNIDAMPGSMESFKKKRKRDINLEIGVGKRGVATFYIFDEPALNTFDPDRVKRIKKAKTPYKLIKKQRIVIKPLVEILNEYLPQDQIIDFMSVDVEGKDYEVLVTNDWDKYRPKLILVESLESNIVDICDDEKIKLLSKNGYEMIAKTFNTAVLEEKTK